MSEKKERGYKTARLVARPPVLADAAAVTVHFQDKEIAWNLARAPWPYTLSDATGWIEGLTKSGEAGTEYGFALYHIEHGLIGSAGMVHIEADIWEIGYWIGKAHWGQGFVTEAAHGLLEWARATHGITRLISGHIVDNPASGVVLQKLGFTPVGTHKMHVRARNCEITCVRYVYGGAPAQIALEVPDYAGHP